MLARLQFVFDSQREFLKDASHELRTPITVIQGHLEMLKYHQTDSRDDRPSDGRAKPHEPSGDCCSWLRQSERTFSTQA